MDIWIAWVAIIVLFGVALAMSDHMWHNRIRRGFGLEEETVLDRFRKWQKKRSELLN